MEASPHPALCCPFVHRIVLTLPSSHSREKDPSWKHPHTLLCVVHVPLWFTYIVFCKFLRFSHINLPKRRLILLGEIQNFWLQPLMPPLVPFCFQTYLAFGLSPLVHLDHVLQVPLFQPHQHPQKKTHPAWSYLSFGSSPLCLP